MNVASNIDYELNNYFTKINLEKTSNNIPISRGTSTDPAKKIAAMHRRNHSNSFLGENATQTNLLEKNFSKLNLFKDEENSYSNSNLNLNNNQKLIASVSENSHPLDNYIMKHKSPVLNINRKKSVSPLHKINNISNKNAFNNNNFHTNNAMNNSNSISNSYNNIKNFNSGNNFFGIVENRKNQLEEKGGVNFDKSNRVSNEFGTIDIKFEIKNKQFPQLPNLYQENKYKKINNNRNIINVKRSNNSVTPNKFLYNAQNISNIIAKKEEKLNNEVNAKGIRRFNYPTATQIIQNRVRNK